MIKMNFHNFISKIKLPNNHLKIHDEKIVYKDDKTSSLKVCRENFDLLELLKNILGCMYISDLRFDPLVNNKAKIILKFLNLKNYSISQIKDVLDYLYSNENKKNK